MRKNFFYTLAFAMIICSCNNSKTASTSSSDSTQREEEKNSSKKDRKEVEVDESDIAGIYTISGIQMKTGDGKEQDLYGSLDECQKKNTYGFNKDGVWYLGGVATQSCTGPDESGTWKLAGNKLTINSQQSGVFDYTIESFDGKNLKVSAESDENGTHSTMITTFTKQ